MSSAFISHDMDLLFPPFAHRVDEAISNCKDAGIDVMVFEAWRSPQRQTFLYSQGRSAPGKIVTKADAWQSIHQLGLAVDIVFKDAKGNPSWEGDYALVAPHFQAMGLEWLGGVGDKPHFQWKLPFSVTIAGQLAKNSGVQAVWAQLLVS
jgi:peptidoglycan L-alanyl-D-glutamate endopeptidase CwlK